MKRSLAVFSCLLILVLAASCAVPAAPAAPAAESAPAAEAAPPAESAAASVPLRGAGKAAADLVFATIVKSMAFN